MKKPSEEITEYWLSEEVQSDYPDHTERGGKWLVRVYRTELDVWWGKITKLLHEGKLGSLAKASTSRDSPNAKSNDFGVICVYSYDADDRDDVMRMRNALRDIGVSWKISYKMDDATFKGKYAVKGSKRISTYFE